MSNYSEEKINFPKTIIPSRIRGIPLNYYLCFTKIQKSKR